MRRLGRRVVLIVALGMAGVYCSAEQTNPPAPPTAPTAGAVSDRATILDDSEVRYAESGGIAGFVTAATLQASKGAVTAEYRPPRSRLSTPPLTGTLTEAEYLDLWQQLDRSGVWTLTGESPPRAGADMIRHELRVRLGSRSHDIVWFEGSASADVKKSVQLAERIRETAERAALLR
jgi:hypothetical protein